LEDRSWVQNSKLNVNGLYLTPINLFGDELMRTGLQKQRLPILLMAAAALLAGIWAGLVRAGWQWPLWQPQLAAVHGPLMVSGFLGTVIGLERVVALQLLWQPPAWLRRVLLLGPVSGGLGALLLIVGTGGPVAVWLLWWSSLTMLAMFAPMLRRHATLHTGVMALGAFCWLAGNTLWGWGRPLHLVVWWWAAFLVLTIAGERLELSRLLRPSLRQRQLFIGMVALILLGLLFSQWQYAIGLRLFCAGLLGLAFWLWRFDLARRNRRKPGLTGYIANCLLVGYIWLAVAGLTGVVIGAVSAGFYYDAILHGIFLGFVFSMIFGHAPIIFPAVLGVPLAYHPLFYAHLLLLHFALLLRTAADLAAWGAGRQWGGLLNGVALLLFLAMTVNGLRRGRIQKSTG
jgi:hypothetical protein